MSASAADPTSPFPPVAYETWRQRVLAELGADAERRLGRETLDGIGVEPLYAPDHLPAGVPLPRVAAAAGAWRIWQELPVSAGALGRANLGRAALARERERDLGGIWLRVDDERVTAAHVATLVGGSLAGGEVELALEWAGEPLAGGAVLVAAAGAAGVPPDRLTGCLGGDPLGGLARRGRLSADAGEQLAGAARSALAHAPRLRAGLVSTAPYADAGADAGQEIAFALATGAAALRWLLAGGLSPAEAGSQLLLSVTVGRDLYLQVAKLRALRLTWQMLLASVDAPPDTLRLHARTAWRTKGMRDPGTDLVRATLETLAAVLGGASDVTCAPILDDETELALGLPLGSATQLILRDEVGLDRVADACGGSWYVESLTAALARRAWELFEGIERRGGMARELAVGAVAQQVAEAAERRRRELHDGGLPIVGVTVHPVVAPVPLPHRPLTVPSESGDSPAAREGALSPLQGNPAAPETFAAAVEGAVGGASLGALATAVQGAGAPWEAPRLAPWRDAEGFETVGAPA